MDTSGTSLEEQALANLPVGKPLEVNEVQFNPMFVFVPRRGYNGRKTNKDDLMNESLACKLNILQVSIYISHL